MKTTKKRTMKKKTVEPNNGIKCLSIFLSLIVFCSSVSILYLLLDMLIPTMIHNIEKLLLIGDIIVSYDRLETILDIFIICYTILISGTFIRNQCILLYKKICERLQHAMKD